MAATPSSMQPLGTPMPDFSLSDTVSQQTVDRDSLAGRPSVVVFVCNHCPYVLHILDGLVEFGNACIEQGLGFVAISSNDISTHPQDGPEPMADLARRCGFQFPYLYDGSQAVARAFGAECTPDLFIYGADGKLAYRGQFDDSRPGNGRPVTGHDARAAIEALLSGRQPDAQQIPSIGCNIKWKSTSV